MTLFGKRLLVLAPALAVVLPLAVTGTAQASPGTVTQTQHFQFADEWGTPIGSGTVGPACGAPQTAGTFANAALNDFSHITGPGNGVRHMTVNGAGDFWATGTFTGTVTLDLWNPANLDITYDSQGNITKVVIHAGTSPDFTITGKYQEWFGFSGNRQNAVAHSTINLNGSVPTVGTVTMHANTHAQWAVGTDPNTQPPSRAFGDVSISCG